LVAIAEQVEAAEGLPDLESADLVNIAWTSASLRQGNRPLFAVISAASLPKVKEFSAQ